MLLAGDDADRIVGGVLGDFVRGPVDSTWPRALRSGVVLHRRIDSFTDTHVLTLRSRRRFSPKYRRYAGIIIDVLNDHFLARRWADFSHISLPYFLATAYTAVESRLPYFEGRGAKVASSLVEKQWLARAIDANSIPAVLASIGARARRQNPLAQADTEVRKLYADLNADFAEFFPLVMAFAAREIAKIESTLSKCEGGSK